MVKVRIPETAGIPEGTGVDVKPFLFPDRRPQTLEEVMVAFAQVGATTHQPDTSAPIFEVTPSSRLTSGETYQRGVSAIRSKAQELGLQVIDAETPSPSPL